MDLMTKNVYANKDVITTNLIAIEHGMEKKEVNNLIKRQIKKVLKDDYGEVKVFIENEDVFIIRKSEVTECNLENLFGSNVQKEAYLITEHGYIKLVMAMNTARAVRIRDHVVDVYFKSKNYIKELEERYISLKANYLRRDAAIQFLPMKDAIENNPSLSEMGRLWGVKNYSILICKGLTGFTPSVYKKMYKTHGLEWRDHIKKTFPELLEGVINTENYISILQESELKYREAKPIIEKYMMNQIIKIQKNIKKITP